MELTPCGRRIKPFQPDVHCPFPLAFIPHNGQLIKTLEAIIKMLSLSLDIVQKAFCHWNDTELCVCAASLLRPLSFSSQWKSKRGQTQTCARLEPRPNAIWGDRSLFLFHFSQSSVDLYMCVFTLVGKQQGSLASHAVFIAALMQLICDAKPCCVCDFPWA